jgi:hypothetical protein
MIERLVSQHIARPLHTAREVVSSLCAMQAQDYLASLWAVGLRTKNGTERDVEHALKEGRIVRTWPMRGTLHLVAAEDVRWMLALCTPRVLRMWKQRAEKAYGLDERIMKKARKLIEKALGREHAMTREALYAVLQAGGIETKSQRGLQIIGQVAQEGLICFGARQGKQQTFVLLDEWVPRGREIAGDEALAELARRYLGSHGPATAEDFAWWSGLAPADAKRAFAMISVRRRRITGASLKETYLLPAFDEYVIAYRDRTAILDKASMPRIFTINGIFNPTIVVDGRVAGTWKRILKKDSVEVIPTWFDRPVSLNGALARYEAFLGHHR